MALLAELGSSLFCDGKSSSDISIILSPSDVSFSAHSLVLEHRSPLLAVLVSKARRDHEHGLECGLNRCRLTIRLEHPFEVGLDTFNTFLRFLYSGNLAHFSQMAPHMVTSLMLLVQWYKLNLVQKDHATGESKPNSVSEDFSLWSNLGHEALDSVGQAQAKNQPKLFLQQKQLQQQQQRLQQQKQLQQQQQKELQLQQKQLQLKQKQQQQQQQQQQLQQHVQQQQHHQQRMAQNQKQRSPNPAAGPSSQAGILGEFPSKMQNLRISSAPAAKVGGRKEIQKETKVKQIKEQQNRGKTKTQVKTGGEKAKKEAEAEEKNAPEVAEQMKNNLEIRVSNLPPGLFKHVLSERLRKELGTAVKVTWMKENAAFVWVDFQVGRKVLAEKPRIFMGRAGLKFNLTKKFKFWPMQLNGIPADVTEDELQRVFLRNEKIINLEYFPKGPRRRESRTYLHFADKESLREFVEAPNSFSIREGKLTLKWEIACGESSLEKGAFDLKGAPAVDQQEEETSAKIRAELHKRFGHVFITRLTTKSTGLVYFEKKSSLEDFLKEEEIFISSLEGAKLMPKAADPTEKIKEEEEEEEEDGDKNDEETNGKSEDGEDVEMDSDTDDENSDDVEKMKKKEVKKSRIELRITDLPLGIFKTTLAEEMGKLVGTDVKVKNARGNSAFVWVDFGVAKKILADKPELKISGNVVKVCLASNFKKWPLQIQDLPEDAKEEEMQELFLPQPKVINVDLFPKQKRAYVHFSTKESLVNYLKKQAGVPLTLREGEKVLRWELQVGVGEAALQKAFFEILSDHKENEKMEICEAKDATGAVSDAKDTTGAVSDGDKNEDSKSNNDGDDDGVGDDDGDPKAEKKEETKPAMDELRIAVTKSFANKLGEVFFVRLEEATEGVVYFEKKSSRVQFMQEKQIPVEGKDGLKIFTKAAATEKKKGTLPGSYPKD